LASVSETVASGFGGVLLLPHLGYALLELTREVGHNAELPLDQHELGAVVHLVFLDTEQPLEARPGGNSVRFGHRLGEEFRSVSSQAANCSPSPRSNSMISALERGLFSSMLNCSIKPMKLRPTRVVNFFL